MVSVVIPVYNPPLEALDACLDSLHSGEFADFEAICVDDGSAPAVQQRLREWQQRDDRVRLLWAEHGGVSHARNLGMAAAQGEYIAFLDSDDRLCGGFLAQAVECLQQGFQYVSGRLRRVPDYRQPAAPLALDSPRLRLSAVEWQKHLLALSDERLQDERSYVNRGPGGKVVARALAQTLPFMEQLCYGEDVVWNLQLSEKLDAVCILDGVGYEYLVQEGSATQSYRENFEQELKQTIAAYAAFLQRSPQREQLQGSFDKAAFEYFRCFLRLNVLHPSLPVAEQKSRLRRVLGDAYWQEILTRAAGQNLSWKHRVFLICCRARLCGMARRLFLLGMSGKQA